MSDRAPLYAVIILALGPDDTKRTLVKKSNGELQHLAGAFHRDKDMDPELEAASLCFR